MFDDDGDNDLDRIDDECMNGPRLGTYVTNLTTAVFYRVMEKIFFKFHLILWIGWRKKKNPVVDFGVSETIVDLYRNQNSEMKILDWI